MKRLRHIPTLFWFLLLWFIFITCNFLVAWNPVEQQTNSVRFQLGAFLLLETIHLSLYLILLSTKERFSAPARLLIFQAGMVFLLTQITQSPAAAFTFSLSLFIVAVDVLKEWRLVLRASLGYLCCLLLYALTIGAPVEWELLWNGGSLPAEVLALFVLVGFALYLQQQHTNRQMQDLLRQLNGAHTQLQEAHTQLSTFALHIEDLTMMNERQRIARELHDTLVQGVAGLIMQLEVIAVHAQQSRQERVQVLVQQALLDARDTLADARCAVGDLRTERLRPEDLAEIAQEEIARFTAATEIACTADLAQLASTPSAHCEQVLRVIREGLTNIARHARASRVEIRATSSGDKLTLALCDDGMGFDPVTVRPEQGHFGLLGLRERARMIGGQLEIVSQPSKGTSLYLRLPLPQEGATKCTSNASV